MSAPERIWAERKTLSGDPVENGYWEARPLYRHTMAEYLRADLCTPTDERVKALVNAVEYYMKVTADPYHTATAQMKAEYKLRAALRDIPTPT